MYDLKRIRYVTEHYNDLQGLTLLPIALWLLGWVALDLGWIRPRGWLANEWVLFLVSMAVVFALGWAIGKLYERAFGWIEPDTRRRSKTGMGDFWVWWPSWMAVFILFDLRPELSLTGLLVAHGALNLWWNRKEATLVAVFGVLIAGMSLAPLLDGVLGPIYPSTQARDVAIKLVTALGLLVVGTVDHLTLVRTLGPLRREEESVA